MRSVAAALIVLIALGGAADAWAQNGRARGRGGDVQPLDEILDGIRQNRPGRLSDAEGPYPGPAGDPRYRLKWLTPDGRVLFLDTDARTGRVLGVEGDEGPRGGRNRFRD